MIDAALMVVVIGAVLVALAVDAAAAIGWLKRNGSAEAGRRDEQASCPATAHQAASLADRRATIAMILTCASETTMFTA